MKDAYRHLAPIYDRLFDKMNKGLRLAGLRMFRPSKGMNILDVGCGTGTHLELYRRYQCQLHGIDLSPAMLAIARQRLGPAAGLLLGDATCLPYESHCFDLVLSMLSLHEMAPPTRSRVLAQMKRVLRAEGHILLIDFHPGPYQPLKGWLSTGIIFFSELAAGREHYKNYRKFIAEKGLSPLATRLELVVERHMVLAGGTFAVVLTSPKTS